jgi:NADH:ubiquinone oxidoreductase subunit 5 (subunit L)/multisubunit Na+/H+ antiporter MnhA subunit
VLHATGTRNIELLGGLIKRMPTTGTTFLVASAAISGLPPFNGFVSELLIYVAAFTALASGLPGAGATVIGSLALIGGLAAACFAKAFGIVFLGEPRSEAVGKAHEGPMAMRAPLVILAALCAALGLAGPWVVHWVLRAARPLIADSLGEPVTGTLRSLQRVSAVALVLLVLVLGLAALRRALLSRRSVGRAGTWDCGYLAPSPRMQYTASSFAQPIVGMFREILRTRVTMEAPKDLWPRHAHLHTHTDDVFLQRGFRPALLSINWVAAKLRWVQQGRIQMYVLYIAITVLVLLLWKLGVPS